MDDRINLILGENFCQRLFVADIRLIELKVLARKFFYSFEAFGLAVDKIIEYNDIVSCVEQLYARVRADEACTKTVDIEITSILLLSYIILTK